MVALLSEDWCAALVAATAGLEPVPGATAVVQHVVNGAPEGTLLFHLRYEDGRVAAAGVGKAPGAPDLTFTTTYGDAQRVASGELDLSAAYMQGTLKA
ncbi:MAG TPA: SCP2 sterol-binding domain-containing protein, partial [Acidimicrobiales bacterium]